MQRQPGWVPRADRHSVSLKGFGVLPDGRRLALQLANISEEGCEVECAESLGIGERIRLQAAAVGDVSASVRWSFMGKAGLRFEERH
jgi:hypothetical protein